MSESSYPRLDIVPIWGRLNDSLIALVDVIPDEQINWSPRRDMWNFRGILLHIADARDSWLRHTVRDGDETPAVWHTTRTRMEIQDAYRRTWRRLLAFLSDQGKLDATYDDEEGPVTGHWIAYHLLEHDIHHRADVFHYLTLLGIDPGEVGVP